MHVEESETKAVAMAMMDEGVSELWVLRWRMKKKPPVQGKGYLCKDKRRRGKVEFSSFVFSSICLFRVPGKHWVTSKPNGERASSTDLIEISHCVSMVSLMFG